MNKKLLLLGIAMVLLAAGINAKISDTCSVDRANYIMSDGIENISINGTAITVDDAVTLYGWSGNTAYNYYRADTDALYGMTIRHTSIDAHYIDSPKITNQADVCVQVDLEYENNATTGHGLIYVFDSSDHMVARIGMKPATSGGYYYTFADYDGGDSGDVVTDVNWQSGYQTMKMCVNDSRSYFYINDVYVADYQSYGVFSYFRLYPESDDALSEVNFDAVRVWNYSTGSGDGRSCPSILTESPIITFVYPTTNLNYNNYTGYVNFTTNKGTTCTINNTDWVNQTGYNTSHAFYNANYSLLAETLHSLNATCNDNLSNEGSSILYFTIDTTNPIVTPSPKLSSNLSIVYRNANIIGDINLSDNNDLYSLNITFDNLYVIFNTTSLSGTSYWYNLSVNPEDYGLLIGVHTLNVEIADSHTLNEISDFDVEENLLTKALTYKFDDGWIKIEPTTRGLFTSFDTIKLDDRYIFELERDTIEKLLYGDDIVFRVTSSDKLDIRQNSDYPGHITSNILKKWLDFASDYKGAKVALKRIDDKTIDVTIIGITENSIVFNSIGSLNVVTKDYRFYYGNFTETSATRSLETDQQTFSLNLTKNSTFVSDINTAFIYNNIAYTPTKTTNIDSIYFSKAIDIPKISQNLTNITSHWNWNVTGVENNMTNSTDGLNITIYRMVVTNCSNALTSTYTLNFTARDRIDETLTNVVPEATFTVWNRSSASNREYNIGWGNSSKFQACIYPPWATLNANYRLTYTALGDVNDRTETDIDLDNVTESITLYLFSTGDAITITVVDEYDQAIHNVEVEAWIYDVLDGNYTLVAEETTDPGGIVVMNLYRDGEDEYKFLIYDGAELIYTSSKFKLNDVEYTFRIVLGEETESEILNLYKLDYDLTLNRTSRNFSVRWSDLTNLISNASLTIQKVNTTSTVTLSTQYSNATNGVLSYNVSDTSGIYLGLFKVLSASDGTWYTLDTDTLDIRAEYDVFGSDSLVMAFFLVGSMVFVGITFSPEIGIIGMLFGLFIFTILGFLQLSIAALMALIAGGIVIIFKLKKQ